MKGKETYGNKRAKKGWKKEETHSYVQNITHEKQTKKRSIQSKEWTKKKYHKLKADFGLSFSLHSDTDSQMSTELTAAATVDGMWHIVRIF